MACSIKLPFWPVAPECISWSKDNLIAVVGGESIAILVPRLKNHVAEEANWDTTVFPVNAFSTSEIPRTPLLSNANFSIGEETSKWTAVRAVWSSPGLAPHKGCALAVLTSNHVLSIWAPLDKPNVFNKWRRHLIINHALRGHYHAEVSPSGEDPRLRTEQLQVSQRILAFAWSHPLHTTQPGEAVNLRNFLDWGYQFLAVATGCGDIVILRVESPHFDRTLQWQAVITDIFNVRNFVMRPTLNLDPDSMTAFDASEYDNSGDLVADALAWSDWCPDKTTGENATLASVVNGRLFTTEIRGDAKNQSAKVLSHPPLVINHLPHCSDVAPGPLQIISDAEPQSIIALTSGRVFQVPIDREQDVASHHLDDRWDEVTGLAVCRHDHDKHTLHIVSLLSSAKAATAEVSLPLRVGNRGMPSWQYSINALRDAYSAELDLEGNVVDRTYGIEASPFSNYVATCSSMHPSDTPAYVIGSEHLSTLNISLETSVPIDAPVSAQRVVGRFVPTPVETFIFEIKQRIENSIRFAGSKPPDQESLATQILNILPQSPAFDPSIPPQEVILNGRDSITRFIKALVGFDPELQGYRAALLADFILDRPVQRDNVVVRKILRKLVDVILALPIVQLHMDDTSLRILRIYRQVSSILESGKASADADTGWQEECPVCSSPVPLVSVKWACCGKGHNFSRCALSFLIISEPGTTKSCGICRAKFLNEHTLPGLGRQPSSEVELGSNASPEVSTHEHSRTPDNRKSAAGDKRSLVDYLFTACDVCIYCGGRFVDRGATFL